MKRNNLKRIVALSVVCISTVALFVGCGDKKSNPYASVEYNVQDYVKLGEYTGLNVDEEITIVTDQDIQDAIDSLVKEKTTYTSITDRYAQTGDRVSIQYIRTQEGGKSEDSKTQTFEIGSGDMGKDFESNMINLAINGKKTFTVEELDESKKETESESTNAENVENTATINVTYEVTLTKIEEKKVPELTDEFIAANSESKTVSDYKSAKRAELEKNNVDSAKNTAKQDLLDLVVEASLVSDTPTFLYNINYNSIVQSYATYGSYFGMKLDDYMSAVGIKLDDLKKDAVKLTIESLVAESFVKTLKIDLTEEEYQEKLKSYVEKYDWESVEKIEESFSKDQLLMDMRKEKTLDYLYENSTVNQIMVQGEDTDTK